ncbi:hypothetical protein SFUMM280S_02641 [Streptomyces fumanus]
MPSSDDAHTGTRIREQRRLARLTQRQLAARMPYSYSLLNQVECGARVATADFVAAVARVLNINVTVLTGQPYITELQRDRLAELVRPIREALDLYDLGPNPDLTVRSTADLLVRADRLCQEVRATHLRNAARALPTAIAELTHTAWATPSTEVWRALASTYRTAHDISVKLGYYDLSAVALDRMGWAAERASDPCLGAVRRHATRQPAPPPRPPTPAARNSRTPDHDRIYCLPCSPPPLCRQCHMRVAGAVSSCSTVRYSPGAARRQVPCPRGTTSGPPASADASRTRPARRGRAHPVPAARRWSESPRAVRPVPD